MYLLLFSVRILTFLSFVCRKQLEFLEKGIYNTSKEEKSKNKNPDRSDRRDRDRDRYRNRDYDEKNHRRDKYDKNERGERSDRKHDYSERSSTSSARSFYEPKFKDEPKTPRYIFSIVNVTYV